MPRARSKDLDRVGTDEHGGDAPLVIDLEEVNLEQSHTEGAQARLLGGKALGLARLQALGCPTPPAFCVTSAALDAYLGTTDLRRQLRELLDGHHAATAGRELRMLAYAEELPGELASALRQAVERLRGRATGLELLAVRSSAGDEDSAERSFAGLHETVLSVAPEGVDVAVRRCWSSLWSEAALVYRAAHGIPAAEATMAVVVQQLVVAEASAVAFTANPVSGNRDELVIQSTHGLGVPLVAGEIAPDTAVLHREGLAILRMHAGEKHLRLDARPGGGVVRSRARETASAKLSEEQVRELAEIALEVERRFGAPVDVEAALARGHWYLIQARPITRLGATLGPAHDRRALSSGRL